MAIHAGTVAGRRCGVVGALLGLMLLLASAAPAHAQTILLVLLFGDKVASENLFFSMKVGTNTSTLTGIDGASSLWAFNYGIQLNIRLAGSEKWWLIPEFAPLSPKGADGPGAVPAYVQGNPELDDLLSRTTNTRTRFQFLDMPVVLSYRPAARWRIGAGPYVAYRTRAHSQFTTTAPPVSDELAIDVNSSPYYQRWDFGMVLEAGFSPFGPLVRNRPTITVRYQWGFIDLLRNNPGSAIMNRTLQISASFPYTERPDKDKGTDEGKGDSEKETAP